MKKSLLLISTTLFLMTCLAADLDLKNAYQQGADFGEKNSMKASPQKVPLTIVPQYKGSSPKEAQYCHSDIQNAATIQLNQNKNGHFVEQSIIKRPQMVIDPRYDPAVKSSIAITKNAKSISADDLSIGEGAKLECKTTYKIEQCEEMLPLLEHTYTKDTTVTVKEKLLHYHSRGNSVVGECAFLCDQGCEQIHSQCKKHSIKGACQQFLQTFRCPLKTCPIKSIDFGKMQGFCVQGDCFKATYLPSPDFNKAISALSGTAYASKDFNRQSIFSGHSKACRKDVVDYSNCCSDSGWGHDLNLAQCNQEEKQLGMAKESSLCHEVGSYCSDEILGFCTMHSQSYCCFNSKLAKIIQEQGRKQLNIHWGEDEHPNCRGLTPQELQQINFSKINFSAFYADIQRKEHLPIAYQVQQKVQGKVRSFYEDHSSS